MRTSRVFGALLRKRMLLGVRYEWVILYVGVTTGFVMLSGEWFIVIPVAFMHVCLSFACKRDPWMLEVYQAYSVQPDRLVPTIAHPKLKRPAWMGKDHPW